MNNTGPAATVIITWKDACDFDDIKHAKKPCPLRQSIGYLMGTNVDGDYIVCHLLDLQGNFVNTEDNSEGIVIPKEMVTKIDYLRKEVDLDAKETKGC